MARIFSVSERTIERRIAEFELRIRTSYSTLPDAELDQKVREFIEQFPSTGYRRLTGFLRSHGYKIQRERIRSSLRRVHPEGVFLRSLQLSLVRRRKYPVRGPLALWYIDGNHKLIR